MRIYKTSQASINHIPQKGDREWRVAPDSYLLRHMYSIDESSPRKKDYILRILRVFTTATLTHNSNPEPGCVYIVVAYFGSSIDGRRRNQVKFVSRFVPQDNYSDGLNNEQYRRAVIAFEEEKGRRISRGYSITVDQDFGPDSETPHQTVPLASKSESTLSRVVEESNRNRRDREEYRKTPEEKMNDLLKSPNEESNIVHQFPEWTRENQNIALQGENKIVLSTLVSNAIMNDEYFSTMTNWPQELLDQIGISSAAQKKLDDFKEYIEDMPEVSFIRKRR